MIRAASSELEADMGTLNTEYEIESTVDLDDIDVEAAQKLLKRSEKAVEAEEVDLPEETPAKAKPKAHAVEEDPTEEELAQYSESVRKRIGKLTFDREEATRAATKAAQERDEAIRFAQQALAERKALEDRASKLSETSETAEMARVEADLQVARKAYKDALDAYDTEAAVEAQMKLADLVSQRNTLASQKSSRAATQAEKTVVQSPPSTRPAPDPRAQDWVARNSAWFQKDKAMTAFAFGVHEDLVDKGVDPRTEPEVYYRKLDEAVKARFPEKFEADDKPERQTRSSPVAPASRSVGGKKRVTLTASELNLARKFGLTPEQFAAEKIKLENSNG